MWAKMRLLRLNKRPLWYANPTGQVFPQVDENGYETGESIPLYTEPVLLPLNVSGASGEAAAEAFGAFTDYSRTAAAPIGCPLVEGSMVWFGSDPKDTAERLAVSLTGDVLRVQGLPPDTQAEVYTVSSSLNHPNYRVVRVAESLNGILYALKEVVGEWSFGYVLANKVSKTP